MKRAANYLFVVSLLGMAVHMIPYLDLAGSATDFGALEITLYMLMPLAVAAFLIGYSKQVKAKGWIG